MSFKVSTSPKFWATVELVMQGEDGRELKGSIKVQFTRFDEEGYKAFTERTRDEPIKTSLLEVVHDWKGAENEDGPVTFTPENFTAWCNRVPGAFHAIAYKFTQIHNGVALMKEVREGN